MGRRPRWYLRVLAQVWKLSYIKPSVPVLGKLVQKVRANNLRSDNFNVSHLPINAEIETVNTPLPAVILEHVIRNSSHRTIIRRCTCRDAKQCPNYDLNIGCLHIGEATREEDTTVARHVSVEEAIEHLHKAINAGLIPFMGHAAGDNVIWNVPKEKPFLTVCFCCPCCCTHVFGYKYLEPGFQDGFHRLRGVSILVDGEKCIGCGQCADQCFARAISIVNGKAVHDEALCKGCGHCANVCPQQAVRVRVENLQETIDELWSRLDREVGGLPQRPVIAETMNEKEG